MYTHALTFVCVVFFQGKFQMRLKAQRLLGNKHVCQASPQEKQGLLKVKPTTFNDGVNVKASILCPTCNCEKVNTQLEFSQY